MTSTITVEASGHECNTKLSTWLQDLLPRTPGAVRKVVTRELILAAREFFEQSLAWRVSIGPKNLVAYKKRYTLSPYDAYSDVVSTFGVSLAGIPLTALTDQPPTNVDDEGSPTKYWLEAPDTVRITPVPATTRTRELMFYVALTPKPTVSHLPRIALTHFYDALLDGALGRLYAHPAKPYSNPVLGDYHLKRFRAAIGKYAGQAKKGFHPNAASWSYPRFGK